MSDIVSPLLEWLNANPQWAGIATFIISAAESIAIIGTIVPGSITMTAIGTLAGAGVIPLGETIIWAILGAIVGDGVSYWLGHYFKDRLRNMWPFRTNPSILAKGEFFVHKYGVMSVFMGRFVGPVRALVPLVAGMLGMKPLQFTIANIASAIGWAPAYMLPGILLGAASLELPPDIAIHVILVLLLMTLFIVLCIWVAYKILQLIHQQTQQLQIAIWQRIKTKPHLAIISRLLKHHDKREIHGQLTLAFYLLIACAIFLSISIYVACVGPSSIMVNQTILHFFRGMRNISLDNIMLMFTLMGQKQVLLPLIVVLFAWLLYIKRARVALHVLALGVLAGGGVFVLKRLFHSPRPWGIFKSPETFSMPSGHTTLATVVFLGLAFFIASSMNAKKRWLIYTPAFLIVFTIPITRLYLGAHWFTDVFTSWLLSACILLAIIISYRRYAEKALPVGQMLLITVTTLAISVSAYCYLAFGQMKSNYAQLDWPTKETSMQAWWQDNNNEALPAYRTSLFGFPSQQINFAWAGNFNQIKKALLAEGWNKPPPRDFISTLHRLTDIESAQYLPMVSPQYLDKRPELILTRRTSDNGKLLVLRLWDSNLTIKETGNTVWVGVIGIVPRSYNWLFKYNPHPLEVDSDLIFPNKAADVNWQWKTMTLTIPLNRKKTVEQNIVFIRENNSTHTRQGE